jgi:hypothetical protein
MPKQIPKKGVLFSRAYFTASSFPETPLSPNPGATKIPLRWPSFSSILSLFKLSE